MPSPATNPLEFLSHAVSLTVLIIGLLGFAFKGWISEWIKSSFSKAVSRELDLYKHALNKELEAYKSSLIRDLEQHKANIDVQRTIAVKMANEKIEALRALLTSFDTFAMNVMQCASLPLADRTPFIDKAFDAHDTLLKAQKEALIFLHPALGVEMANLQGTLAGYLHPTDSVATQNDPELAKLRDECAVFHHKLCNEIFAPPSLNQVNCSSSTAAKTTAEIS